MQRILLDGIAPQQRIQLAQLSGIDLDAFPLPRRTGLPRLQFRFGLEPPGREALLLALLLHQQFGRRLLLPRRGDLLELLLPRFGLGRLLPGFGLPRLLLQIGFPGIPRQRVERIDGRRPQRIRRAPQRVGQRLRRQRIGPSGNGRRRFRGTAQRIAADSRGMRSVRLPGFGVRRGRHRIGRRNLPRRAGQRIGGAPFGSTPLGRLVDREEKHRIGTHEERIALREVVAHHRRIACQQRIARLLPIFAVIAEGQHLVLRVVDLHVPPQDHVVARTVEVDAVAPHLLLFGQHVAVAGDQIERVELLVGPAVGIEVVAVAVPDIRAFVEKSVVGGHVIDHRVAPEFVLVVAHLHPLHGHQLLRIGIVVAADRLEQILAVREHAAPVEPPHVGLRIEPEIVGVERGVAVDDLHDVGIDPRLVQVAVVFGPVAVDIGRILVDEHVAEELDAHVRIAHRRVARDDGPVVLRGEIPHQEDHRIARGHGPHEVRLEVDEFLPALLRGRLPHTATRGEHPRDGQCRNRYGDDPAHRTTSPSVCSRTPRRGTRGRYRRTCRRSSSKATP